MLRPEQSIIQEIKFSPIASKGVKLCIKRDDLIHPHISGNKYRKLKYNLLQAEKESKDTLLTFGGAYSNHIAATASAGKEFGFKTIGIIRGDELAINLEETLKKNHTLQFAASCGMQFKFVSRTDYRKKHEQAFIHQLKQDYGDFYLVPEGGTNQLAVKGCTEILSKDTEQFDWITTAVGTGGTISGIINASKAHQKVIGFPALKGDFLTAEIQHYATKKNWKLNSDFHFGGYAKTSEELIIFINTFKKETGIALDPVYTGKMMYGLVDLIRNNYFDSGSKILVIHTGGLQGIAPMNTILRKRNSLEIE